jgi:hypothetical protein
LKAAGTIARPSDSVVAKDDINGAPEKRIQFFVFLWGGLVSNQIAEARIAVEAAIAVAEIVSQTEIVQSTSFNQLITYLHDAREALAEIEGPSPTDEGRHLSPKLVR